MSDRGWRITEAAIIHAAQQTVSTMFERVKARGEVLKGLGERVTALESRVAEIEKKESK